MQDEAVEVPCQNEIAAPAKEEASFPGQFCCGQLLGGGDFLIAGSVAGQGAR